MYRQGSTVIPASLPRHQSVFDGREVVRDFLNKRANDIPHMWGLYRRRECDFASDFYDNTMYMYDTDACIRAMVRGKFGFVHEPLYMYRRHSESISENVIKGSTHRLFESMREIERWGPVVMGEGEYRRCARRHLRAIYRYMLRAGYRGQDTQYAVYRDFLKSRNIEPGFVDFAHCVAEWPFKQLAQHAHRQLDRIRSMAPAGRGPTARS